MSQTEANIYASTDDFKSNSWIVDAISELLIAAPSISVIPGKEQIAKMVRICLEQCAQGKIGILARLLNEETQQLNAYLQKGYVPCVDTLLHLCHILGTTPLKFLTENVLSIKNIPSVTMEHLPRVSRGDGMRLRSRRVDDTSRIQMKAALEDALTSSENVSLDLVAKRVGYKVATLRKHFPELCRSLVKRNHQKHTFEQIQQQVQEILSNKNAVPSVSELARQMGCSFSFIHRHFPELSHQIVVRYREEKERQRQERMYRIHKEIQQVVLSLHQQGIYPSARKVTKKLSDPHILRIKDGLEVWRATLKELGYSQVLR